VGPELTGQQWSVVHATKFRDDNLLRMQAFLYVYRSRACGICGLLSESDVGPKYCDSEAAHVACSMSFRESGVME
jgi:hypothetical protein